MHSPSPPGLGFYRVERYFYPTMGRNLGKNDRNTFLPGRNGRNMVEMLETSLTYIKSNPGQIANGHLARAFSQLDCSVARNRKCIPRSH